MLYQKGSILQILLLLTSLQLTIAAPPHFPELDDYIYHPRSKTRKPIKQPPVRPQGINWINLLPTLGAAGILAILAGAVFLGTKLDESHLRAIEEHKRAKYQNIVDSEVWLKGHGVPASINGEEAARIADVGMTERKELAWEEERHRDRVGMLKQEIIVKYFEELEKIQENHRLKNG
jgi:hypothetical protein